MDKEKISQALRNNYINNIILFDSIDSTNQYAKDNHQYFEGNTLIVANEQTNGQGRYGRHFVSKKNSGVYFTITLKENNQALHLDQLTMLTAIAVCETIAEEYQIQLKIKWVNDLFLDNKKVAGILCHTIFNNLNKIDSIIIGIGINLVNPNSHEIKDVAKGIFEDATEISKERLIALIVNRFFELYTSKVNVLPEYKNRMFLLNQKVNISIKNQIQVVKIIDVLENGALVIIDDDNQKKTVHSGEISILKK